MKQQKEALAGSGIVFAFGVGLVGEVLGWIIAASGEPVGGIIILGLGALMVLGSFFAALIAILREVRDVHHAVVSSLDAVNRSVRQLHGILRRGEVGTLQPSKPDAPEELVDLGEDLP